MSEKAKTTDETKKATEAANAEAEKILAEAREKAAEIVAAAESEAKAAVEASLAAAKEATEAAAPNVASSPAEELVPVRLFKDNDKYKDDVFVAVNGKSWQIKRGETVMLPRYVADVLEQSMKQDTQTANLIETESSRYEAEAKARNL